VLKSIDWGVLGFPFIHGVASEKEIELLLKCIFLFFLLNYREPDFNPQSHGQRKFSAYQASSADHFPRKKAELP
jgi:hypothetical protein